MNPDSAHILTINGGSSSVKFALYRVGDPLERGTYGNIDRIGLSGTKLTFNVAGEERQTRNLDAADHSSAVTFLMDWLDQQPDLAATRGIGHRVVHGMQHAEPEIVTPAVTAPAWRRCMTARASIPAWGSRPPRDCR